MGGLMSRGRFTIAAAIAKQIGKPRDVTVHRPGRKPGEWIAHKEVQLPVSLAELDAECPPVALHTDLLTELPALNFDIEADEASYKAERRRVRELAAGIERMEAEVNRRVNWLAQHCDTPDLAARLERVAQAADLDTVDKAEEASAIWLGDELCLRWRSAIAKAREFNVIRDQVAAHL